MAENSEKNSTLMQENAELSGKLKNLLEQYEVRENVGDFSKEKLKNKL